MAQVMWMETLAFHLTERKGRLPVPPLGVLRNAARGNSDMDTKHIDLQHGRDGRYLELNRWAADIVKTRVHDEGGRQPARAGMVQGRNIQVPGVPKGSVVIALSGGEILWRSPCDPKEFASRAMMVPDPLAEIIPVPFDVAQTAAAMLSMAPDDFAQQCASYLAAARRRRKALSPREQAVRNQMQPGMADVYSGKQFVLLQDLLEEVAHEDTNIVGDLVRGLHITGNLPYPSVFERRTPSGFGFHQ